jgi:hypothetical protein
MRDIKFRVWDADNKRWIDHNLTFVVDPINGKFGHVKDHRYIFQQYSGLTDKAGKEIYEGDIVKHGARMGVIKWGSQADGWPINGWHSSAFDDGENLADCYVIGNIFETPELILEQEGNK